jgi:glucose/arabinose dehydrogenase
MKAERTLILSLSAIALVACTQPSASAPTQAPTLPTSAPTSAPTPARAEPTATPPPAASALPGGDLSDADMTKILQASIAAYPWRIKRSTTIKLYAQQTNGLVEAQSSTRVHMVTQGDTRGRMFTLESIFITPTLYMKATGAPPELLQEAGAQEGKWLKVPEDNCSYLAG